MKVRRASCPGCGAPVEFRFGNSIVSVCEFCHTAVARGDKDIEDYGKVSDLVETDSVVQLGTSGSFRGKPFEVIGRVQYDHSAGGVWDEWYLRFPGDKMAWLAEAQGQLHLTFERPVRKKSPLPAMETLSLGDVIHFGGKDLTVAEIGVAKARTAQGEIPWPFRPGDEHRYVDLHGAADEDGGAWFATFDYSRGDQTTYVGRTVTADKLNLSTPDWQPDPGSGTIAVPSLHLNCPKCGGSLDLHAPKETLRVGCQHCGALLENDDGRLQLLTMLEQREMHTSLPLGVRGNIRGTEYIIIGIMARFVRYAGSTYPWTEYLLYAPGVGFRWLVENDRHWSFVEPVPGVAMNPMSRSLRYDGDSFRVYDRATAIVRHVIGEFYWKVQQGDRVETADFIAPPRMLSIEDSGDGKTRERVVSLGTYMTPAEIESAFEVENLTRPWGVGVIQPSPPISIGVWSGWFFFLFYLLVMFVMNQRSASATPSADGWLFFYAAIFVSAIPIGCIVFKYNFEVSRWKESDFSPYASGDS
ncbi:DUF4178 domain-containing protein [Rhodopirellula halodulae]|uniref:DUF4178 domain-containing protein n=1 Tax=Rhodopirellula halodulae TaxID=2894198 RepID=UPI0021085406|nr:DUF4178 domain-containing protein [Rhodopirellula sp. JC737]MCC9656538.1 DUF4178 domain-containing protein [Rhodopirellula sp. JC737]